MKENIEKKIQHWVDEINNVTHSFEEEFGSMDGFYLNHQPNPAAWSIGQNMDHLIKVNETYFPVIDKIRKGDYHLPFISNFNFITNFFGNFILKSVSPNRDKKVKTFAIWEPAMSNIKADILTTFKSHQEDLINLIHSSKDLLCKRTIVSSPANKIIVYPLEKAFDIIVSHEKRHFNQAMEVKAHTSFAVAY